LQSIIKWKIKTILQNKKQTFIHFVLLTVITLFSALLTISAPFLMRLPLECFLKCFFSKKHTYCRSDVKKQRNRIDWIDKWIDFFLTWTSHWSKQTLANPNLTMQTHIITSVVLQFLLLLFKVHFPHSNAYAKKEITTPGIPTFCTWMNSFEAVIRANWGEAMSGFRAVSLKASTSWLMFSSTG